MLGTDHLTCRGGLWFFVLFRIFFPDNTRVRIFIFLFFPEFNIRLYDKNSESDYFFFLHQNQNIFFSNIENQNIFFKKKAITPLPPQVKWSVPYVFKLLSIILIQNGRFKIHWTAFGYPLFPLNSCTGTWMKKNNKLI